MVRTRPSKGCVGTGTTARISPLCPVRTRLGNILQFVAISEPSRKAVFLLQYADLNIQTTSAPLLAWEAPALPSHDRTPLWYAGVGICTAACIIFGIATRNWTFVVAVLLTAGMYAWLHRTAPLLHRIEIHDDGFTYDSLPTSWGNCRSFWLIRTPGYTELHILKRTGWERDMCIQTDKTDVEKVRAALKQFLPEQAGRKEHVAHRLARTFKF